VPSPLLAKQFDGTCTSSRHVNGKAVTRNFILQDEIAAAQDSFGEGPAPNKNFGSAPADRPPGI